MPTIIATDRGLPSARARRTAYLFQRYKTIDIILVVWAIAALLIAGHATFGAQSEFLGAFDVSVAPF